MSVAIALTTLEKKSLVQISPVHTRLRMADADMERLTNRFRPLISPIGVVSIPQPTERSLSSPEILLTKFEALALSEKGVRYITRAALGQTVLSCLHENSTGGPTKSNSLAVVASPTTLLLTGLQIALFPPVITSDECVCT